VIRGQPRLGCGHLRPVLAAIGYGRPKESQRQRQLTKDILRIAEATLLAAERPELVAYEALGGPDRAVHLATYGSIRKPIGEVEFRQRAYQPHPWFVGALLRSEPAPFANLPPANPLVRPE